MEYSQRWQELFDLPPGQQGQARTVLASADSGGPVGAGGGQGTLQHTKGPWSSASATASELRTNTEKSRTRLAPGHTGVTSGGAGLASAAALTAVLTSWENRLTSVRDECDHLDGALLKVAKEMGETDLAVKDSLTPVRKSGETP
ncbi:hypothetical protein [Streptomyces sp. CC210A]|uniref:hypothetical protein n=1 Tax=Streptomyces sp. CC210A TaxID=2898184 RepID=UPI001F23CEEE|nr:hypothetical protein [Streptomyces sp. CC210A]